jgi:23S rRNA (adenine2030-N6)-methyltransferase
MLSYQHIYHAGNRADIQKHSLLASTLEVLTRKDRALTYMETHAGRGVYDLNAAEAEKTGEAKQGWLALDKSEIEKFPGGYVSAVRDLNNGKLSPLYPGSPLVAAQILRAQDEIHLMELHPQEYSALIKTFRGDKRAHIHRRDGLEGVLALSPPVNRRGLVLVDPSYEMKDEYETIPDFAVKLLKKWPEVCVLIWCPMLPAGRHEGLIEKLRANFPDPQISTVEWGKKGEGMYGSIMAGINLPYGV